MRLFPLRVERAVVATQHHRDPREAVVGRHDLGFPADIARLDRVAQRAGIDLLAHAGDVQQFFRRQRRHAEPLLVDGKDKAGGA
ncbi:hypothetical protein D3C81_1141740 [compost metagenome]